MSLAAFAIGVEVYQVIAHVHCDVGRTVPKSHRSTFGFGTAILVDALSYLLSCYCLYVVGGHWELLLFPMLGHVFYGSLFMLARPFYLRVHDYRQVTIYSDRSFCRAKRVATTFDACFHLLAVVLLARLVHPVAAVAAMAIGSAGFFLVFTPTTVERLLHRRWLTARAPQTMQTPPA